MSEPKLFSPLTLRGLTLRNRAVMSPMCQYLAVEGAAQDWHFAHHARFAAGGLGLAFVEATAVTRLGRITYGCTGIWDDAQIPGFKRIVDTHRAHGAATGIQIGHSGRRGSAARPWDGAKPIAETSGAEAAWQTVGPSALPEREGYPVPRELSVAEIEALIEAFGQAAKRCLAAGFDIVEIHGAHGYLIHSFFSPVSNRRSDAFGGTREKRMRLALLVAETVRAVWPEDKPVFYRASAVDNVEGGLVIEDTVALARALKQRGVDLVDCSSGGMSGPATFSTAKIRPGYQVPYAAAVRAGAELPTMAVGAILEPKQAEAILAEGKADLIALGRQLMAEPHWLYRAALELGLADPHAVLPRQYAFYLERRAAVLEP
ncbi:MAG: NADH:flavin oxidoreductase/NADH oxidase [Alphaproteobacteria bacterium]|nr:NADH:flavin oxidoreductase/NADH oxidase [Alphaproteobacteria bacterium]